MKAFILISAFVGALIVTDACAQVEVTVPETGRVKTTAKVENGILGVTNSFTIFRGTARECVGACFYASATKTRVWLCRDRTAISIVQEENRSADAELLSSALHLKDTLSKLTSSACRSTPVF